MKPQKIVRILEYESFSAVFDGGSVKEAIKFLQRKIDSYPEVEVLYADIDYDPYTQCEQIKFYEKRLENSKELEKRIEREREAEAKREAIDRKEFERLKKKFENE